MADTTNTTTGTTGSEAPGTVGVPETPAGSDGPLPAHDPAGSNESPTPAHDKALDSDGPLSGDGSLSVHDKNVALPEVRTGKVDFDEDFHKEQQATAHHSISFDTLAVPEYHTGKRPSHDCDCTEGTQKPHGKKRHSLFGDLARTLANGGSNE